MKRCTKCKLEKPLDEFYNASNTKDGKRHRCKPCQSDDKKIYDARKREIGWEHKRSLERKYGITESEYDQISVIQNDLCAICKRPCRRRLSVDHDHITNKVRGLLCHKCNVALGLFEDNIESLETAIAYLRIYEQSDRDNDCRI